MANGKNRQKLTQKNARELLLPDVILPNIKIGMIALVRYAVSCICEGIGFRSAG